MTVITASSSPASSSFDSCPKRAITARRTSSKYLRPTFEGEGMNQTIIPSTFGDTKEWARNTLEKIPTLRLQRSPCSKMIGCHPDDLATATVVSRLGLRQHMECSPKPALNQSLNCCSNRSLSSQVTGMHMLPENQASRRGAKTSSPKASPGGNLH